MGNILAQLVPLIFMTAVLYFIIVIPQMKRKKEYNLMLENLKVHDEILTRGGIIGSIILIYNDYVIIETGPDNTKIKLSKTGILEKINVEKVKTDLSGYKHINGEGK
ncbi:MAG: preprotein translocase subunit YajC [Solirubrobacterales bacterium]